MAAQQKDESQIALAKDLKNVPWCDQYERMISGMLYDSFVPELKKARFKARAWAHQYNTYWPTEGADADPDALTEKRQKDLAYILGKIGSDGYIEPPFRIDYGCNISIGKRFYGAFNLTILDCGLVTVGDRVMIGPNVSIFAATHETEVPSRREDVEYTKPVVIGNDCWIGGHAVILPGVTIGKGCTIAASSVVTKDIPDWSIAKGSPAKVTGKVTPVEDLVE
ncbi:putative acetyltransferase [Pseudocercospora fuligena]|uniref:Putative acetyltransferase n=1 Tax=Pseudocercospora fuligena TaxID=685502 RepID=A0A8H6RDK9_9PEZI|nr:putative acetyltransferase [Pseudocercospora fuligena]